MSKDKRLHHNPHGFGFQFRRPKLLARSAGIFSWTTA
jgi:hypothetical protein